MDDLWEIKAKDLADALATATDANKADFSQLHRAKHQQLLVDLRRDIDSNNDSVTTTTLPAYQLRKRQEILKSLEDQLKALQPATQSKFSFTKQTASPSSETPAVSDKAAVESQAGDLPGSQIVYTRQKHIIHTSSTHSGPSSSSPSFANLSRCLVDLRSGPVASLYLKDLEDTVVIASDVQGSVLVHNAKNCLFAINCHQFRIHSSSSTKIIINARSTPVMEDSHSLSFALLSPDGTPRHIDKGSTEVEDFDSPNHKRSEGEAAWSYLDTEQARQKYILLANLPADEMDGQQIDQILSFLLST